MSRRKQSNPSRMDVNKSSNFDGFNSKPVNGLTNEMRFSMSGGGRMSAPISTKPASEPERICNPYTLMVHSMGNDMKQTAINFQANQDTGVLNSHVLDLTLKEPVDKFEAKGTYYSRFTKADESSKSVNMKLDFTQSRAGNTLADGFCHICNKHFCNKYYLRKHRADVHNIFTDYVHISTNLPTLKSKPQDITAIPKPIQGDELSSIARYSQSQNMFPPIRNTLPLLNQLSIMPPAFHFTDPNPLFRSFGVGENPSRMDYPRKRFSDKEGGDYAYQYNEEVERELCMICKQSFISQFDMFNHLLTVHSNDFCMLQQAQHALGTSGIISPNLVMNGGSSQPQNWIATNRRNEVPQQSHKLTDRVTCDICEKELCNKYFLKTHKTKVHGVPAEKIGEASPDAASSTNNVSKLVDQTDLSGFGEVPLMSEEERDQLKVRGIDPDTFCVFCQKSFCSKYFLRTHQQNMHRIKHTITTPALKRMRLSPNASSPTHKPRNPSPAQSRVRCSVCHKELCNKYFLRCHMINVHNIVPPEADNQPVAEHKSMTEEAKTEPIIAPNHDGTAELKNTHTARKRAAKDKPINQSIPRALEIKPEADSFNEMQPFIMDSDDPIFRRQFNNCMIYLPIKSRVNAPLELSVKLRPLSEDSVIQSDQSN